MFGMRGPELLIVFAVIVLLFGATRLPALGKALGEGMKNFRKGIASADDEKEAPSEHSSKA
jgi:sec-independent protein translocase protein TatA